MSFCVLLRHCLSSLEKCLFESSVLFFSYWVICLFVPSSLIYIHHLSFPWAPPAWLSQWHLQRGGEHRLWWNATSLGPRASSFPKLCNGDLVLYLSHWTLKIGDHEGGHVHPGDQHGSAKHLRCLILTSASQFHLRLMAWPVAHTTF